MNETVAIGVGENGNYDLRMVNFFGGRAVYVRKCRPGKQYGDDEDIRHIGGIILPDQTSSKAEFMTSADRTEWVEVLALGPKVGTVCRNKGHRKKFDRDKWAIQGLEVGDIAHVKQDTGIGIQISPVAPDDEFFIEESWLDFKAGEYDG